ncbi:MAG: hypothetical protein N2111_00120 [Candidatus Sumerlaeaceae bacterium]|nr:hypothetical protein [Candidatus Sumerlaeaceae bacterium]
MREVRGNGVRAAAVAAGVLAVWWHLLLPSMTFAGMDFLNLLYPQAVLVQSAFLSGEFPLWNWYTWGGSPLLAAMQSAALYPPMWLALCGTLPYALQIYVLAHLMLAAVGAARFCQAFAGFAMGPAVLAGCGYACGAFFLGHIEQTNSVASACWTPWILLFAVSLARTGRGALALALSVSGGLLAGHPQYVVLAVLAAEVYVALCLAARLRHGARQDMWRRVAKPFLMFQCSILASGLLAAGQLLPTQELSVLSERVRPYADPFSPALSWRAVPARFWPGYLHTANQQGGQPLPVTELGIYAGMAMVPLFFVGAARLLRRRHIGDRALLTVWILAFLYALGAEGGVAGIVSRFVPFLAHSRGTARALAVETLLYVTIAGVGLAAVQGAWAQGKVFGRKRIGPILAATVVLMTLADLMLTTGRGLETKMVPLSSVNEGLRGAQWLHEGHNLNGRVHRFMADDSNYYLDNRPSAVARRMVRLQPNANLITSVRMSVLDGYEEALLPTRSYANFLRRFNRNLRYETLDAPLLALLRTSMVLTEYPVDKMGALWTRAVERPDRDRVYTLLRSPFVTPWIVDERVLLERAGTTQGLDALGRTSAGAPVPASADFEPTGRVWIAHPFSALEPGDFSAAAQAAGIQVVRQRTCGLDLQVASRGEPSRLLLLLPSYPGWNFEMRHHRDHVVSEPLRAAGPVAMRFDVPALAHEAHARLSFRPFSFRLGMYLSLLASGAGLLFHLVPWLRRRAMHLTCECRRQCPDIASCCEKR